MGAPGAARSGKMTQLKQVCLYCGCSPGSLETTEGDPALISHGVCSVEKVNDVVLLRIEDAQSSLPEDA